MVLCVSCAVLLCAARVCSALHISFEARAVCAVVELAVFGARLGRHAAVRMGDETTCTSVGRTKPLYEACALHVMSHVACAARQACGVGGRGAEQSVDRISSLCYLCATKRVSLRGSCRSRAGLVQVCAGFVRVSPFAASGGVCGGQSSVESDVCEPPCELLSA